MNRNIFIIILTIVILTSCADALVDVGGYIPAVAGDVDWGTQTVTTREFFTSHHNYRIRQNGTVEAIEWYIKDLTDVTGMYITFWRMNISGTGWDRVGITENLLSNLTAYSVNYVDLGIPLTGIQEGDYFGYRVVKTGATSRFQFLSTRTLTINTYFLNSENTNLINFNWLSGTTGYDYAIPIKAYMEPPDIIWIGDSLISGAVLHRSYIEPTNNNRHNSTISNFFYVSSGLDYQNMGYYGHTTTQIKDRFINDTVNASPTYIIIEGGTNDIHTSVPNATILSNYEQMVSDVENASIIPVVLLIFPRTYSTNAQSITADYINTQLLAMRSNHSTLFVVDVRCDVGEFRVGGTAGNCWDIKDEYEADTTHYNTLGYSAIATSIYNNYTSNNHWLLCSFWQNINITIFANNTAKTCSGVGTTLSYNLTLSFVQNTIDDYYIYNLTTDTSISRIFNESSNNGTLGIQIIQSNLTNNANHTIKIYWNNGTKFQDFYQVSNGTGYLVYNTTGFEYERYTIITQENPSIPYIVIIIATTVIISGGAIILRRFRII